ncbi:LysR family transcriptional regulator [Methylobacterium sp. SyP6R]|uniref:LysR family transcriptional regulator n=1 Tax=Methylobacterium sp. SyP6R TaxID=2718876 RepID=UPI001F00BB24|nr:LysR family transcriptional regulator [Methylobacterium sp. SyP6R]MCF4125254.1 LysR family transcriptional regulator [Methylobacterium sp. SyP6R]
MRRLPPFPGLVAFDAVLRHGSVTRAAAALGLTQSAVSHRLRGFEEHFGAPLLERLNPGLRPTPAGERLARDVAPLLETLAGLRERVAGERASRPFRIGVGGAVLAWWLSPRLPDLAAAFPAVTIEVTTWDGRLGAEPGETDLALHWIPREAQGGSRCEVPFPAETVFPVAAPLLRRSREDGDWRRLPLLAKGQAADGLGNEWSWVTWLGDDGRRPPAMRFRDIGGALRSAQDGNGIVLARSLLVADALRRRRLSRLVRGPRCGLPRRFRWRGGATGPPRLRPRWRRGSWRPRTRPSDDDGSPGLRRHPKMMPRLPLKRRPHA